MTSLRIPHPTPARATSRDTMAQLLVCASGCCCGRTDRGKPPVPLDWLKAEWKARRLMKPFQLSISGCLGPCDRLNVVAVVSPTGTLWLGDLREEAGHFEALVDWAEASVREGALVALPPRLTPLVFERFPGAAAACTAASPIASEPLPTPAGDTDVRIA